MSALDVNSKISFETEGSRTKVAKEIGTPVAPGEVRAERNASGKLDPALVADKWTVHT